MNFQRKYLKKWFSGINDDHPIIKNIKLYPKSKKYWNNLLRDLDNITGLRSKISEMKNDPAGYKSIISELKFCRNIKTFNPKFILSSTSGTTPDIEATVLGRTFYFEVKSIMETDEIRHVFEEIRKTKSYYIVWISYYKINKNQSDDLISIVKTLIDEKSTGIFVTKDGEFQIEIEKKRKISGKSRSSKTAIIMGLQEPIMIGKKELSDFRKKIVLDFFKKERQLKSKQPIFLVFYLDRWIMTSDDIKQLLYGTITEDYVIGFRNFVGFEKIFKVYNSHLEIVNSTEIVPKYIYPEKNGLYFMDNFDILNGVITFSNDSHDFFINPFAEKQIRVDEFRILKSFFRN